MRDLPRNKLQYEIILIRLDLSCNFKTLQLFFLLDTSSDKHVNIWDYGLIKKTFQT